MDACLDDGWSRVVELMGVDNPALGILAWRTASLSVLENLSLSVIGHGVPSVLILFRYTLPGLNVHHDLSGSITIFVITRRTIVAGKAACLVNK